MPDMANPLTPARAIPDLNCMTAYTPTSDTHAVAPWCSDLVKSFGLVSVHGGDGPGWEQRLWAYVAREHRDARWIMTDYEDSREQPYQQLDVTIKMAKAAAPGAKVGPWIPWGECAHPAAPALWPPAKVNQADVAYIEWYWHGDKLNRSLRTVVGRVRKHGITIPLVIVLSPTLGWQHPRQTKHVEDGTYYRELTPLSILVRSRRAIEDLGPRLGVVACCWWAGWPADAPEVLLYRRLLDQLARAMPVASPAD
jgi:hypothetical protein